MEKYPHLCSPITIGNVTFKNRMFSSPMGGTDIENDGCIGPKSTAFYELRGRGGAGAEHFIPAATVICALGMKPRRELVDSLRFAAPYVAVIGDANKVDSVKTAVYQGYHAALDI